MLLRRHGGALKADLRREYGVDLLDLWRGRLRLEDLADFVAYLPPGSAVWREHGGPAAWSDEVAMGAAIEHAVRMHHWSGTADAKEGRNRPEPLRPPEDVVTTERNRSRVAAEVARFQRFEAQHRAAIETRG